MKGKIILSGKKIPFNHNILKKSILEFVHYRGFFTEKILFFFVTDDELLKINQEFLKHDYYTDIITFDYSKDRQLCGEIFISLDRVKENATQNDCSYETELIRVIAHGLLHMMGFKDKSKKEALLMRKEEDRAIDFFKTKLFHVEQ